MLLGRSVSGMSTWLSGPGVEERRARRRDKLGVFGEIEGRRGWMELVRL